VLERLVASVKNRFTAPLKIKLFKLFKLFRFFKLFAFFTPSNRLLEVRQQLHHANPPSQRLRNGLARLLPDGSRRSSQSNQAIEILAVVQFRTGTKLALPRIGGHAIGPDGPHREPIW
jgi:hypothetical protein